MRILVINPGSTSTKMAVYDDEQPLVLRSISHSAEELARFDDVMEQQDYRRRLILDELRQMEIPLQFDAVIGRGGLVKPIAGGVYEINQLMIDDTHSGIALHNHACNLGCLIAHEIAEQINGCRSFIADPGVVDELNDYARISGSPLMNRICIWHALNQRAIARRYAAEVGVQARLAGYALQQLLLGVLAAEAEADEVGGGQRAGTLRREWTLAVEGIVGIDGLSFLVGCHADAAA